MQRNWKPRLGVEIARYGEDETTIYRREGGWVQLHHSHSKTDTMATTGHIVRARDDINTEAPVEQWVEIVVDEVGVGAGVLDRLLELDVDVVGFSGGSSPVDKERFINARAEAYWMLREAFEQGEIDIDPDDDPARCTAWITDVGARLPRPGQDRVQGRHAQAWDAVTRPADAVMMAWTSSAGATVDVGSHQGGTLTGDLLSAEW